MRPLLSLTLTAFFLGTAVPADDSGGLIAPGAEVKKLAGGMKFTEGPVWIPQENMLIFSDIPNSVLMKWSAERGLSRYRESENANGNILDLQGRLISCQHSGRNLVRTESDGSVTVIVDSFEGKKFNSPNDTAVRSDGTFWFTDPPWGLQGAHEIQGHWVFQYNPKTKQCKAIIKDLAMPNGIVFSPDETRLYVADTGGHQRHPDPAFHKLPDVVRCYEVSEKGELGKLLFTIDEGSDGMAVDVKGNLYTTHGGKVNVFDADGKLVTRIDVPEGPANVCFGGEDYKTMFITARTSLYSLQMNVAGAKPKGAKF